jgi:hypothetical protein
VSKATQHVKYGGLVVIEVPVSLSELKRSSKEDWKWMVVGCGLSDGGD